MTTSTTDGPAHALDTALRRALSNYYPEIHNFHLKDYKVRILDSHLGTAAITKVQVSTGFDPKVKLRNLIPLENPPNAKPANQQTNEIGLAQGVCERATGVDIPVNEDSERANNAEISQLRKSGWDTVGVSANIIKASWDAIVDSIEYGLYVQNVKPISHAKSNSNK
jgi:hypothetical protein